MIDRRIIKIYYSVLFVFTAILTISYINIAKGGAVLWIGPNMFYLSMLIFASTLILVIFNSDNIHFQKCELLGVFLFCLSLPLLLNIGINQFPYDLDSIISMQSISYISHYGFSAAILSNNNYIINATYSLPMMSILSLFIMQIVGISYINVAKYVPVILLSIFFIIYYVFISKFTNKRSALLSLMLISSFMWGYSGVFNNVDMALVLFVLCMLFLLCKYPYRENIIIIILFLITFALTHHLTYAIFIVSVIFISIFLYGISIKNWIKVREDKSEVFLKMNRYCNNFFMQPKKIITIIILAIVLATSYYILFYLDPIVTITNAFTHNLAVEGAMATGPTEWTFPLILQRFSYIIFLIPPTIISIIEIKRNFKRFLLNKNTILLATGIFLFFVGIMTVLIRAPFNFDRVTIFAWLFYLPGAIFILTESSIFKNKFIKQSIIIFICSLLIFANIFVIPINILDHSGSKAYEGDFKNWIKLQEWNSAIFLNKNVNNNDLVIGDEVVQRICIVNSPNYEINFNYLPGNYNEIRNLNYKYLVLRNENYFRIIGSFYQTTDNPIENIEPFISETDYIKIMSDRYHNLIYDNKEVKIFSPKL